MGREARQTPDRPVFTGCVLIWRQKGVAWPPHMTRLISRGNKMQRVVFLFCVFSLASWSWAQTTVNLEQQVKGELPVAKGGTGAADAADARTNLGLTTDFLDEDHTWRSRQDILNLNNFRYAHLFANGGDGSPGNPWTFAAGHPWADAIADGGKTVILTPGEYSIRSCPAIVPTGVTIWSFNRNQAQLRVNCHAVPDRLDVTAATNAAPIQITTGVAHSLTTGDWIHINGVPGNSAANGDWQVTNVDSNNFTLDGSAGNGDFVDTKTGFWAAKIFAISSVSTDSPVGLTTSMPHNLATDSRVLVKGVTGSFSSMVNGRHYITSTGANTLDLELTAHLGFPLTGGTVRGIVAVDVIATEVNGKYMVIRGLSFTALGGGDENFLRNVIGFQASEAVVEEVDVGFMSAKDFDRASPGLLNASSAAFTFTGNGNPGETLELEMTGGRSRATAPYAIYTVPAGTLPALDQIVSTVGGLVRVAFAANHGLGNGEIVTISSTTETIAAGAAGTWNVAEFSPAQVLLINSSGTGTNCTSGCGGATGTESALRPNDLAGEVAKDLNSQSAFAEDYVAVTHGPTVRLLERRFGGRPGVFAVTTSLSHTTTAWATNHRGGNSFLTLYSNAFSSKFERIACGGLHSLFHCVTLQGINNQQSFRDVRLSGGNNAGWGMRFTPTSNIQDINVDTMTVEASYGGIEIASMTGSNISGLYMELGDEYGILIDDLAGSAEGSSFVHGNTISSGFLLGDSGLILEKGRDLAVENTVIGGECRIGMQCENCTIRSSFSGVCTNESLSGYFLNHSTVGKPPAPIDRYGESLATATAALSSKPVTNHVLQSEDLTASPWFGNSGNFLTPETNPFGETQQITRISSTAPPFGQSITMGQQTVAGLSADTVYTLSYWLRVVTPGATCFLSAGSGHVNRRLTISDTEGWLRVAGVFRADSSGNHNFPIRCSVQQSGLPDFTYDVFGVMVSELQTDGALPAYVPTTTAAVTVPAGIYAHTGELSGVLSHLPRCKTYSVSENDLTAAAATQDLTLFQLPARGVMTGVTIKHSTPFGGGTLTGMSVSVGDSSDPSVSAPAFDVFQAASDTTFADSALFKSTTFAASDVLARFTATGDDVGNATVGVVDVTACVAVRP